MGEGMGREEGQEGDRDRRGGLMLAVPASGKI